MKTIKDLKELIKQLSVEQRVAKLNRKTVKFVGERIMEPYVAVWRVQSIKEDLRSLFIAYGILRGKSYEQIEPTAKSKPNWNLVEKYKLEYGTKEIICDNKE